MAKKFVVLFLTALFCSGPAWSQTLATFMVDPSATTGQPGQTISFVIHVSTTENIGGLQYTLEYNSQVATFQGAVLHPSMPVGFAISNINTNLPSGPFSYGTDENVLVQISGNGISSSFTGEQDVAIMTFLFKPSPCGTSPMNFDHSTCQRTHLSTINLLPICNPGLEDGSISSCSPSDSPIFPGGKQLRLLQNVPNPFNPATTFRFEVPVESPVQLQVFDVTGRVVRVLLDTPVAEGVHEATWDGRDDSGRVLPSGVYYYQIETPYAKETRRALMLK